MSTTWQIPQDSPDPRFFATWGHDVSPEDMTKRVFGLLSGTIGSREARELIAHHRLHHLPVERTHWRTWDGELKRVSVLNVTREPHPMTLKTHPEDPEKIARRLELNLNSSTENA